MAYLVFGNKYCYYFYFSTCLRILIFGTSNSNFVLRLCACSASQARLLPPSLAATYKVVVTHSAHAEPNARSAPEPNNRRVAPKADAVLSSLGLSLSSDSSDDELNNANGSNSKKKIKNWQPSEPDPYNRSISPIVNNLIQGGDGVLPTTTNFSPWSSNPFHNITSSLGSKIVDRPTLAESYSKIIRDDGSDEEEPAPVTNAVPSSTKINSNTSLNKINSNTSLKTFVPDTSKPDDNLSDSDESSNSDGIGSSSSKSSSSTSSRSNDSRSSSSSTNNDSSKDSSDDSSNSNCENMTIGMKIAAKAEKKKLLKQSAADKKKKKSDIKASAKSPSLKLLAEKNTGSSRRKRVGSRDPSESSGTAAGGAMPGARTTQPHGEGGGGNLVPSGWCNVCGIEHHNKLSSWWYSLDTCVPEIPQISIRVALQVSKCEVM